MQKFQEMSKDWENNPKILRKIIENLSEKIDELQAKATAYDRLMWWEENAEGVGEYLRIAGCYG